MKVSKLQSSWGRLCWSVPQDGVLVTRPCLRAVHITLISLELSFVMGDRDMCGL